MSTKLYIGLFFTLPLAAVFVILAFAIWNIYKSKYDWLDFGWPNFYILFLLMAAAIYKYRTKDMSDSFGLTFELCFVFPAFCLIPFIIFTVVRHAIYLSRQNESDSHAEIFIAPTKNPQVNQEPHGSDSIFIIIGIIGIIVSLMFITYFLM